jgi:hypothetical protein
MFSRINSLLLRSLSDTKSDSKVDKFCAEIGHCQNMGESKGSAALILRDAMR